MQNAVPLGTRNWMQSVMTVGPSLSTGEIRLSSKWKNSYRDLKDINNAFTSMKIVTGVFLYINQKHMLDHVRKKAHL